MKLPIKNKKIFNTKAYIDGGWIDGQRGKSFQVFNPFDEKEIAKVSNLGRREALQAIEAAYWAFPAWSSLSVRERVKKLIKLSDLIKQNSGDLALLITLEQGKPLQESKSEVFSTLETIHWLAEEAKRIHGTTQVDPDNHQSVLTIRQPIGVVGIITPCNFPLSIPASKSFGALAAGCTVVLKPSEDTPLSSLALAYLSQEAGIPPGVFNVITCEKPDEIGEILTTHPLIGKLTFTGSSEVGKKLLRMCSSTAKKATMELGGNCPLIVFEDADYKKALLGIFSLKFYNAGQCSHSINRILLHRSIYDSFINQFVEIAKNITVGSGLEAIMMGPLVNQERKQKIVDLIKDASEKGAQILVSTKKNKGLLCHPVIIKNAQNHMRIYNEEILGPIAAFYSFDTEDEAVAIANDTEYGLASYFYTENLSRIIRITQALEAGSIGVNTIDVYSETAPFRGWKESGIGKEGGMGALNQYCELKTIYLGK